MNNSLNGCAWLFVSQVLDLSKWFATSSQTLTAVSVDDVVFLTKQFLQCQADLQANDGLHLHISFAYHYTKSNCMDSIKQNGLMTLADHKQKDPNLTGVDIFGDGVYTSMKPYDLHGFAWRWDCGHAGSNASWKHEKSPISTKAS